LITRIGNAQAFWGDRPTAAFELLSAEPSLDYLTMDYLAEVSLSIMAAQRQKDPTKGYAADFLDVMRLLAPLFREGCRCKIVCNAGGLNPQGCGEAVAALLKEEGLPLRVAVVAGDDVCELLQNDPSNRDYRHWETDQSLQNLDTPLTTANAYLGAAPLVPLLEKGADIIVTGRVADPSLVVACAAHAHGWKLTDWHKIAGATVAGHLIECGTQVCGGFSTNWMEVPNPEKMGYPIVEIDNEGNCIVTKPQTSGGAVTIQTVKEQLLYEIGDPANYLSPDVTVDFTHLTVEESALDRIQVKGARGSTPTDHYKVSATYFAGYKAEGMLTIVGENAAAKAQRCGEMILQRLEERDLTPERSLIEVLGAGGSLHGVLSKPENLTEVVLRVAVADPNKARLTAFAKEIAPLVTSGPQGVTGYASGRPKVRPIYAYWPCLVEKNALQPEAILLEKEELSRP
jgi:hypothetical protein